MTSDNGYRYCPHLTSKDGTATAVEAPGAPTLLLCEACVQGKVVTKPISVTARDGEVVRLWLLIPADAIRVSQKVNKQRK